MKIAVEFKDYEEMLAFARQLSGKTQSEPAKIGDQALDKQNPPEGIGEGGAAISGQVPVQTAPQPVAHAVSQAAPQEPVPMAAVPTASVSYTLDDLARAGMSLMDIGRREELQTLLSSFGVDALPQLPKDRYGAFATALRGLGAKI